MVFAVIGTTISAMFVGGGIYLMGVAGIAYNLTVLDRYCMVHATLQIGEIVILTYFILFFTFSAWHMVLWCLLLIQLLR